MAIDAKTKITLDVVYFHLAVHFLLLNLLALGEVINYAIVTAALFFYWMAITGQRQRALILGGVHLGAHIGLLTLGMSEFNAILGATVAIAAYVFLSR